MKVLHAFRDAIMRLSPRERVLITAALVIGFIISAVYGVMLPGQSPPTDTPLRPQTSPRRLNLHRPSTLTPGLPRKRWPNSQPRPLHRASQCWTRA